MESLSFIFGQSKHEVAESDEGGAYRLVEHGS